MRKKKINFKPKNAKNIANILNFRLLFLQCFFVILAFLLITRLAFLTCYQYKYYATLSLKNQMSILPIPPQRGIIMDRNGEILAENQPVYVLELIPERVKNIQTSIKRIRKLLPSITDEDIVRFEKERRQHRRDVAIPIKMNLNMDEVATFSSHQYMFPGIAVKAKLMRYYPFKKYMAHVLGYVGRINLNELKNIDNVNYQGSDYIGKIGLEKYYEDLLHGKVGYEQVETNVNGKIIRVINKQAPIAGQKIYLTLDTKLQETAYKALKGLEGSAVLIDVKSGGVLAMVSRPSFDPNLFAKGIAAKDYQQLILSPHRPLFHRAIRGLYPPASTVKPFIAIAGLHQGVVIPQIGIHDPGWFRLPGVKHNYRDWKRSGHGPTNLKRAIMVSCDTFFYQLGNKLGITALSQMMKSFGFGQLTGIDLPEEVAGLMPDPAWKRRVKNQGWYPGDTIITSIGQGFWLASPLQLAHAVATLSQHGIGFEPHFLDATEDEYGHKTLFEAKSNSRIELDNPEHWTFVHDAMHAVVNTPEGTGYMKFGHNTKYQIAGKTGTAQVYALSQHDNNQKVIVKKELRDHSWFIAFAPAQRPQVAIAVMVEHDSSAAHVARAVLDQYFSLYKDESQDETNV
ncbi:MAG: penicillin-binding protein 2 [Gammaproteobacteria bacterium]|nr:penicillin-binding protein 2 [Gammaproteobacteria bacterium]